MDSKPLDSWPAELTSSELYLYTTSFKSRDGKLWTRTRIGPFTKKSTAEQWMEKGQKYYPGAWITPISNQEFNSIKNGVLLSTLPDWQKAKTINSQNRTSDALLQTAQRALVKNDLDLAIKLFEKILRMPRNDQQIIAQEYLGVARMRKGQLAQAKLAWKIYLQNYPESEGSVRIKQRLQGLYATQLAPLQQNVSGSPKAKKKDPSNWRFVSGLSQYLRKDSVYLEAQDETRTQINFILTDINTRATHKGESWDTEIQFSGGYSYDLISDGGPGNKSRLSTAYIDLKQNHGPIFTRIGRQSRTFSGIFGRFDGALFGYQLNEKVSTKLVAGFPVQSSSHVSPETNKQFYGLAVDFDQLLKNLKFSTYLVQHKNDHHDDRKAIGIETRYTNKSGTLYSKVDYDYQFKELNSFTLVANWRLQNKTQLRASIDHRASPFLTLNNAILGQQVESLQQFSELTGLDEQQLQQLALDRTARLTYANMGFTQPLTPDFQAGFDVSLSRLTSTKEILPIPGSPATFGIEATDDTGNEMTYALQFFGSNLFMENDSGSFSYRYFDGHTQRRNTADLSLRFPVTRKIRFNPRIKFDTRYIFKNDTTQTTWRASLKANYRWTRKTRFEFESGYEQLRDDQEISFSNRNSYFYNIGYRTEF
ncbi:MAG: tetratricopeptide repeat protein [bacterium]